MRYRAFILLMVLTVVPAHGQRSEERYEVGVFVTGTLFREIGSRDSGPGTEAAGFGGRFVYHALRWVDLESDLIVLPGNSATAGNRIQGFFGAKTGLRLKNLGLFVKARPGFIHFYRDPFGVGKPGASIFSHERASSTEPAIDLGGVIEVYTRGRWNLRFDLGKTIIQYAPRTVVVSQFLPPMEAGGFKTHNWQGSFGVGYRF